MTHDIFIVDDQHPEDQAMLQALYSRSPASVVTHLDKLKASGSGKFMSQYYVGYGHASIGDCGSTTCFIEQVSMLVAKAVQENPLYSGQEASTRYLDFSKQAVIDPYGHPASTELQKRWQEIYNDTLAKLIAGVKAAHPFDPAQYKNERIWDNTLNARAFDIARSLLPFGTTTLLSWSTSLRQARDNLRRLKHHPLKEVRDVAQSLFAKLVERYPNSFKGDELDLQAETPRDAYAKAFALRNHYETSEDVEAFFKFTPAEHEALKAGKIVVRRGTLDVAGLREKEKDVLAQRPEGSPLPMRLEAYGVYNLAFLLDFGSFRDLQRHRNGVCQIPLTDARYGLHPWYLGQFEDYLSPQDFKALQAALRDQYAAVAALPAQGVKASPVEDQYLLPMGTMALVHVAYAVPQMAYVGELRSQRRFTLRCGRLRRISRNPRKGFAWHRALRRP
jgi:thymidylate synthase ThyX